MDIIKQIEREQMRTDIPAFKSGDTVKVHLRIVEGEKERIQVFQGNVSAGPPAPRSPCARFPTAWAWNAFCPCTPPSSTTSKW